MLALKRGLIKVHTLISNLACALLTQDWKFAEENKTSWCKTKPFVVGSGDMVVAAELRR